MASTSETGHAKNLANFQELISFVVSYGAIYNPSKTSLKLSQLIALKDNADEKIANVIAKNTDYNNKINERQIAFAGLKQLSTRLFNALQTTDASEQLIKNAKSFNRKIQGQRASAKNTMPLDLNNPIPKTISSSQQSYTQQVQHLAALVSVLNSEPTYSPNETDLQISTLITKQNDLITKNNDVATAYADISTARIERNSVLYNPESSIFDVASEVKKYIKSIYGATSPQFAQVKGLKFTKPRA